MHGWLRRASLAALLVGCGSVASTTDAGDANADAALICAMGSRACAGQCVANTSPVWAFDDRACGTLGAACLTGTTCQNGSCVPAVADAILDADFTRSKPVGPDLIAAAGALYWSGSAGFSGGCMPAAGGCAGGGPLAGYFGGNLRLPATNGGNFLYYYYPDGTTADEIWVLDRTSTGSRRLVDDVGAANGLAVDAAGNLFFTTAAGRVLVVAGGTAAPAALIETGPANAQKIAIAGSTLYYTAWGSGATTGEVRAVPIGGAGAFTTLASAQAKPTHLTVVDNRVFWTNQGDGTVWSQDITTPAAAPIQIARDQSTPLGIAADASAVYWVNQGSGTVMKALRCGGGTIELASGQNGATDLVILDGHLYWTAVGANQLMTIPE
jgi:hypothetical protein